ncbi:Isochorismatase hydrolase [Thozetella sp. PMI_491]|nr:Isochorismatase hydrolase [Thozetella sp. PMI_491]
MGSSGAQRRALFVIDLQHGLATNPSSRVARGDELKLAASSLLDTVRGSGDTLVVVVQHEETPESGDLVRGTEPWKVEFEPRPDDDNEWLVAKTTPSAFDSNPDLADRLRAAGVSEIVALGIQSDCCVQATCNGALDKGFGVTVLAGAHSTYDFEGKTAAEIEKAVEDGLAARGAKILKWEDAAAQWAATPSA